MAAQQTSPLSAHGAIPPALFNACFALLVVNACYFPVAYVSGMWIWEAGGLGIPTDFVNVWAAGKLVLDGHPALAFVSWLAFSTESWHAFFHWMPMFSQAFLTEGKATWWKLQSIFSLVRFFGGPESLAWAFQWVLTASVATVLVTMWRSRVPYTLKAAALALGTLLTTPYLFIYDMMVLAIPVGFLVRIGLKNGFRSYELPALGCALALFLIFTFTGEPTGFVINLIVGALVLRRAGPWWRRVPVPSLALAGV